jgi:hypothetical protein
VGDQKRAQSSLASALKLDPSIPEIQVAQHMLEEAEAGR